MHARGWRARWPFSVLIAPNPSSQPRSRAQKILWALAETGVLFAATWISSGLHFVLWQAGTAALPDVVAQTQSITLHSLRALTLFPTTILVYAGFCSSFARRFPRVMQPPPALYWRSQITPNPRKRPGKRGGWARFSFIGGARGHSGWGLRFLLTLGGCVVMVGIVCANQLNDTPGDESPISAELCMDPGWATLVSTGLAIPLEEEILFRGLLFARTVRFLGLGPGVLFSAAMFGMVHFRSWSDADKVVFASSAGVVLAMLTHATQSILPATVVHACNNLATMLYARRHTPTLDSLTLRDRLLSDLSFQWRWDMFLIGLKNMLLLYKVVMGHVRLLPSRGTNRYLQGGGDRRSKEEQEADAAEEAASLEQEQTQTPLTAEEEAAANLDLGLSPATAPLNVDAFLAQAAERSTRATVIGTWLCMDGSLQPAAGQLVTALFRALDRDHKGYLSTEELAWILALQQPKFIKISAAVGIIERRIGGLDAQQETQSLQLAAHNLATLPADQLPPALSYPSDTFFTPDQSASAQSKLSATLGVLGRSGVALRLPSPKWGSFERAASTPQIPHPSVRAAPEVSPACKATQRAMLDRFTALHWRAFHLTHFHPASSALNLRERRFVERHIPVGEFAAKEQIALEDQGCTLARFRSYVQRESLLHPIRTAEWISACVQVIQGKHAHPMQTLIEAHEAGRQGYLGRRLPEIVEDQPIAKEGVVPVHPAL